MVENRDKSAREQNLISTKSEILYLVLVVKPFIYVLKAK